MSVASLIPGVSAVEGSAAWWAHELYPATTTPQSYLSRSASAITRAAERWKVSPAYLWGIFGAETSYGAGIARSSTGAMGPFQFEPATARAYGYPINANTHGITDWTAFDKQAEAAAHLLHDYGFKSGNSAATKLAIERYNAGPSVRPGGVRSYYDSVIKHAQTFRTVGPGGSEETTKAAVHEAAETPSGGGAGAGLVSEILAGAGGLLVTGVLLIAGMALVAFGIFAALRGGTARAAA